jgi:hypothetical protein
MNNDTSEIALPDPQLLMEKSSDKEYQSAIQVSSTRVAPDVGIVRSITRLIVGGLSIGYDGLITRLQEWERTAAEGSIKQPTTSQENRLLTQPEQGTNIEIVTIPQENETNADLLRLALVGMVFETEKHIVSGIKSLDNASRVGSNLVEPLVNSFQQNRLLSPLHQRFEKWVQRGQEEVNHWIELGRSEDEHSQALARAAFYERVDTTIDYLSAEPGVRELVQSQGVSLAGEVVEEVRERSVSADNFLEGVVRTMLRRPQRSELPEPPIEIKSKATPPRQIQGRIIQK